MVCVYDELSIQDINIMEKLLHLSIQEINIIMEKLLHFIFKVPFCFGGWFYLIRLLCLVLRSLPWSVNWIFMDNCLGQFQIFWVSSKHRMWSLLGVFSSTACSLPFLIRRNHRRRCSKRSRGGGWSQSWPCSVRLLSAMANALLPNDWLLSCCSVHRN